VTEIPTRFLGRTGVGVTVLGYGAFELRGQRQPGDRVVTEKDAERILGALLSSGINYIDTSPDYGTSESYLGRFISHRRDEFFLASKCGCKVGGDIIAGSTRDVSVTHSYDGATIRAGINQSLKRLNTDYLDLVQFHHNPSRETLETAGAIDTVLAMQREGKVRFVGCSSELPNVVGQLEMGVFDVIMLPYSGIDREHEATISLVAQAGVGVVVRGSIGDGNPSARRRPKRLNWSVLSDGRFDDLFEGASKFEFMLRFVLSHPDVSTTIVGTLFPSELDSNVSAVRKGPLSAEIYSEAKRRFASMGSTSE
jgi:aryl-alcohol dehydrogenase-like predicted oxidoreductase